jgi:hypothetical protein
MFRNERVRRIVKQKVSRKLQDGETLGGVGSPSKFKIEKLQNYYGLATRRNAKAWKPGRDLCGHSFTNCQR